MKNVFLLTSSVALAVVFCLAGTHVASALVSAPAAHAFQHLGSPLWTSEATYLDRENRTAGELLEIAARTQRAGDPKPDAEQALQSGDNSLGSPQAATASEMAVNPSHAAWCRAKYRSYRAEDNSYRAFSGARRACVSSFSVANAAEANAPSYDTASYGAAIPVVSVGYESGVLGSDWCRARFRSYRASDHTYQPHSGGSRRTCTPPSRAF
ncbi:BA14K family protein [Pararhizobium antarcticum]|uniref:Lectin-like protein BA14k n=1 Tax=Pararhizobium antarcticum TaxID=1798805 RepID=A0A657LW36_9HYPH|nr:BA14K family protein [Pararhizobium antarcticum]OJF89833.1 hypothetical protein AX761_07545 [Rhizobium sp. 58]OJF99782.1 hypothetical protein AX760_12060 [Pararhizobium antarcticum]